MRSLPRCKDFEWHYTIEDQTLLVNPGVKACYLQDTVQPVFGGYGLPSYIIQDQLVVGREVTGYPFPVQAKLRVKHSIHLTDADSGIAHVERLGGE